MKEQEYISLTNLTKIRLCETILRDLSFEENDICFNIRSGSIINMQLLQDKIKVKVN